MTTTTHTHDCAAWQDEKAETMEAIDRLEEAVARCAGLMTQIEAELEKRKSAQG